MGLLIRVGDGFGTPDYGWEWVWDSCLGLRMGFGLLIRVEDGFGLLIRVGDGLETHD